MKQFFFSLLVAFAFFSCGSDDLPECVDAILDDFRVTACEGSGELTTWRFRGEMVYCFDWGVCQPERFIEIYDESCNLICELGGLDRIDICDGSAWTGAEFQDLLFSR